MAVQISGNDITVPRDGSFTRNVTIGGTLTYEDVTNIDSVGLVTARNGIEIGARPGVAASISVDGNMIVSGISTFGGDIQVPDKIIHAGDTNTAIRFPSADTFTVETGGTQKLSLGSATVFNESGADVDFRIESSGTANMFYLDAGNNRIGLNRATPIEMFEVGGNIYLSSNSSNANDGNALKFQTKAGGFSSSYGAAIHGLRVGDTSSYLRFDTGGQSEKMRLDSSGRLLIGTTTEGSGGADELTIATSSDSGMTIRSGTSSAGGIYFSDGTSGADEYRGVLSYNHAENAMRFYTDGSERARIDSSGLMGLGTNSPSSFSTYARNLVINQSSGDGGMTIAAEDSASEYGSLHFCGGTTVRSYIDVQNGSSGRMFLMNKMDGYMGFGTNNSERLRIHNNGRMSFNNTTFPYGETFHFYNGLTGRASMSIYHGTDSDEPGLIMRHGRSGANSGAWTGKLMQFRNSAGNENGSIASNASVTAYNTSSDYRLKENEVTISDAISKVKQLKPYTFNFKVTPDQKVDGFFAHEAQEVVSYAVLGEKDAEDMQQMDYGKLTPLLTAALKEAVTEIESLKSRLDAAGL